MDVSTIIQLISNLGFPIVCCGALFWKMNKQDENHKEEIGTLTSALNNNTIVLEKVCEKLGGDKE